MKNDVNWVGHIAQTTAGAMISPQNRFRQNGTGETRVPSSTIYTKGKYDNIYWMLSALLVSATATMGWWLPSLQQLLG